MLKKFVFSYLKFGNVINSDQTQCIALRECSTKPPVVMLGLWTAASLASL